MRVQNLFIQTVQVDGALILKPTNVIYTPIFVEPCLDLLIKSLLFQLILVWPYIAELWHKRHLPFAWYCYGQFFFVENRERILAASIFS